MGGELTAGDVATFTNNRLADDSGDGPVTAMLNAALAAARNYCGWHVSPVREDDELVVDGPGGRDLFLPSMKIRAIKSIVENGKTVPPTQYVAAAGVPGMIRRRWGGWTREYAGITVTLDHGYTEDEAADWRRAVCQIVDQMSLQPVDKSGHAAWELIRKRVDDVEYSWSAGMLQELASKQVYALSSVLANYRILPVA